MKKNENEENDNIVFESTDIPSDTSMDRVVNTDSIENATQQPAISTQAPFQTCTANLHSEKKCLNTLGNFNDCLSEAGDSEKLDSDGPNSAIHFGSCFLEELTDGQQSTDKHFSDSLGRDRTLSNNSDYSFSMESSEQINFQPVPYQSEIRKTEALLRASPSEASISITDLYSTTNHDRSTRSSPLPIQIIPQRKRLPAISSSRIAYSSLSISQILHENNIILTTEQNINHMDIERDQEAWLLYKIFDGFCIPPISRASCSSLLEMERTENYENQAMHAITSFPEQPVILQLSPMNLIDGNIVKSPVLSLLQPGSSHKIPPILFQLPIYFGTAFLRILIRLLTHESDSDYNEACLLTQSWKSWQSDTVLNLKEDPLPDVDHATRRPHLQYSVTRFQCSFSLMAPRTNLYEERTVIHTILNLLEKVSGAPVQYQRLTAPLSRLTGLLSTAGMTPQILRRIILISSQQSSTSTNASQSQQSQQTSLQDQQRGHFLFMRLCLVRALKTAAAGSSRSSLLPKASPSCYFSFGGTDDNATSGMQRKINGLPVWPFRNDFGVSMWFRAEHFPRVRKGEEVAKRIILFSVRTDEGGGIEISLIPIDDNRSVMHSSLSSNVRTIAVSVFDSNYSTTESVRFDIPSHHVKARGGCVLLPQVWYHISVRHTRSRLKGVFSLATRQQLTVLLDGKTMISEPLNFPNISDSDAFEESYYSAQGASSLIKNSFKRTNTAPSSINITLSFAKNFEGQTGTIYVFKDNVSDASFRSLFEATGGAGTVLKRSRSLGDTWDARHTDIVRKSRVLDVNISSDDADEIVLSQRRPSVGRKKIISEKLAAVLDFGEGDEVDESELPLELQRTAIGSKIFISWNPRRILGDLALELHVGAHCKLHNVHPWRSNSVQDVIGSLGGIQALIPIFRSFLGGDIERACAIKNLTDECDSPMLSEKAFTIIPDLIRLVSSFVQDHNDNARELLRCGGIDVVEQLIYSSRKFAAGKDVFSSVFGSINSHVGLAHMLVDALLSLRSACSHYVGLETKVYSRLIFNIPLWLGGFQNTPGAGLHLILLPILSSLTKLNPEKVRECVGIRDMVQALKEYTSWEVCIKGDDYGDEDIDRFHIHTHNTHSPGKSLTYKERKTASNFLLAMIFNVLSIGVSPTDLSPFLHLISYNLETEWEEFLLKGESIISENATFRGEVRITVSGCNLLFFLFQLRPCVPGLYESFAQCCGGVQNAAGWLLCSLVNSYDDEIRGLGIRCLACYLEVASRGADVPLSMGNVPYPSVTIVQPITDVGSNRLSSTRFTQLAKGLAAMSPNVRSIVLPSSKLTTRVVYKLLWHLLKGRRSLLGSKTTSALLYWITVDDGSSTLSLSAYSALMTLQSQLMIPCSTNQIGYLFDITNARAVLSSTKISMGKSLRNPLAISTILRLLRFLGNELKDQWLQDIFYLCKSNRKCTALVASLPDWQQCLFPLLSETIESVSNDSSYEDSDFFIDEGRTLKNHEIGFQNEQDLLFKRLDLCLALYSMLLGHLVREGGDQALEAVERTASMERTCVNGQDVLLLVLGSLCSNIFEQGSLLDMGSLSAQDWEGVDLEHDSPLLRQSARLVTDAILSNGTKGLDMPSAVRSWRGLRHLAEVIVAVVKKSGFGVVDLFDYAYHQASSIDNISGGFHGIRLPEIKLHGVSASEYARYCRGIGTLRSSTDKIDEKKKEVDRRLCVRLSAQILNLLDAFIFPQALEESHTMSQIHSLALVRNSEVRLGNSQGPLLSSAIRLSFVLLSQLEPCSVTFLQSVSRLRGLLCWALELLRESTVTDGSVPPFHKDGVAHLDRLILAIVLHCHRSLGRCSSLLSEIESSSFDKYFRSRETQNKYYRRLLRVALELREVVSTAYRGRNDVLNVTLSSDAFDALRMSLEGNTSLVEPRSKESTVRDFLTSKWVSSFQDCETKAGLVIPEQVSMYSIPLSSNQQNQPGLQGFVAVEKIALECNNIVSDFEKAIDSCFKEYLDEHQRWTETNAVRDLEYEGDTTIKRFSERYKVETIDAAKIVLLRRGGADNRWKAIVRKAIDPWKSELHWKLARYTDQQGRRTLLVQNQTFDNHADARYDLMVGKDREIGSVKAKQHGILEKDELSEVIRRNAEAFVAVRKESYDQKDDDSTMILTSDSESVNTDAGSWADNSADASADSESVEEAQDRIKSSMPVEESGLTDDWDKIDSDEIKDVDSDGDVDGWAKLFIWSENETAVARFEHIMIVSLQTLVEGKVLLTTHGLYFHQTGDEINVMTKEAVENNDVGGIDGRSRRWRLTRLTEVHGRRFMLRSQALELFFSDSHELLLNFPGGVKERERFYTKLRHSCKVPMLWSTRSLNPRVVFKKSKVTEQWRRRKISNFEYLMALNRMAGRSFNDLTQYPVFPWVIADYTSETIDLTDSRVYRDLSKPVGAINPDRLAQLLDRYKDLELFGFAETEKFLYGSHYSSPGIVLHYLIRQEPFTTMAIDLQSGRFDCPDRLFFDVSESWNSCLTSSSDMKELIPEFFTLPEMFLNTNKFPFGSTQTGRIVDNVTLPPWAKGSAYDFVRINRLALESEYVSLNIHHWIDLIFGYKQTGAEAIRSHNLFHHLSYEGSVDLDKISDEIDRTAAETHIQNFGQTPGQLAGEAHPCRLKVDECWSPILSNHVHSKNLRCYTPAKQFANKRTEDAKGGVMKIHVFSDVLFVVYEDARIGTYKWYPGYKNNRLKMDKLRPISRREVSTSRVAMKRGSALSPDIVENSSLAIGNWSFAITVGGLVKEDLRRKAVMPSSRLISTSETSFLAAEASAILVSCGYWDETLKAHTADSWRVVASETGGHRGPIRCLAMGQDGGLLVTGGHDCTCRVWVVHHPDMVVALSDGYVQTALGGSNDGEQLLSCCHVLWGHDRPVNCIALDSDLDAVVSGSQSGLVCIHTIRRGEFIRSFRVPSLTNRKSSGAVSRIAMGMNGYIIIQMEDNGLHTYTVNAVRLCSVDAGERLNDMIVSSTGEILVTGGKSGQVLIRNVSDLQVCSMLDLSRHGAITSITLTPTDLNPIRQYLFIGSEDGMITIVEDNPVADEQRSQTISF